jgi:methyl-accepting chemotaxis protein
MAGASRTEYFCFTLPVQKLRLPAECRFGMRPNNVASGWRAKMKLMNLNVKGRVYSGFGAVIAIMGVAVGIGAWGLLGALDDFNVYSPVATNSTRAVTAEREFLETRRLVRTFLINASEESGDKLKSQGDRALAEMDDLIPRIINPERKKMLEEARADIADYLSGLQAVVALKLENQRVRAEEMDVDGRAMAATLVAEHEQALASGNAMLADKLGSALHAVMTYRLDVSQFLDRGLVEAGERIADDRVAIEKAINDLGAVAGSDPDAISQVRKSFEEYAAITDQVVAKDAELTELVDQKMSAKGNEITTGMSEFVKSASVALQELDEETRSAMDFSWTIALIVAGVAAAFGVATAWLVSRSIVKPVTAMTNAMGQLAGGDTGTEIPARDRTDEIGKMAGAVQVFKDNMIESERLRAELEEAK